MDSFEPVNIDLLLIKSGMNPAAQKLEGLSYHVAATEAGVHEQYQLVLTWKLQLGAPSKSNHSIHLPHASIPGKLWLPSRSELCRPSPSLSTDSFETVKDFEPTLSRVRYFAKLCTSY